MNKILIVDDNPKNIQLLANILKNYDFEIEYAQDGSEATELASHMEFDLILMDVMMPKQDGFDACISIKKAGKNTETPLIFITAKADEHNITKGFKVGGVDYITKPFNAAELLSRIETHISLKKSKEKLKNLNTRLEGNLKQTNQDLEITRRKLKEALARKTDLDDAKSEFLKIISHEIRTPLNGIIGVLDILEEVNNHKKENEFFNMLNTSCKRLERFSLLALEISKLKTKGSEALKQAKLSSSTLLNYNLSERTEEINNKELTINTNCENSELQVDNTYLDKCLTIILKNLIKHSPQKSKIDINGTIKGDNFCYSFKDEGPGLPPSVTKYGPDAFLTDKHIDDNPGLELYYCKLIAEAHGGKLTTSNNGGAQIELQLPL